MYTARVEDAQPLDASDLFTELPAGVDATLRRLRESGHAAVLVGGCVRDRLLGGSAADFDVATGASPEDLLAVLRRAIPIGGRHGTVMQPTADGPVDVTSFRAHGGLEADLAHRDFTINAMAWDPSNGRLIDPFGGRRDLAERRLRAVGSAAERFDEDPLRALRAARLVAVLDLEPASDVPPAMRQARSGLARVARERIRHEIEQLIVGIRAERGLRLLRETGIESDLAPGVREDAAAVVARLPRDGTLRLAAWLRGTRAERILIGLRFPRRTTARVAHLLRQHPIGADVNPKRDVAVRRLIRRAHEAEIPGLIALRRAEIAVDPAASEADLAALERCEAAIERVRRSGALALHRFDLALDGREVMQLLGCGPGPQVGRALRHLTERVIEDPGANRPDRLREILAAWREDGSGG